MITGIGLIRPWNRRSALKASVYWAGAGPPRPCFAGSPSGDYFRWAAAMLARIERQALYTNLLLTLLVIVALIGMVFLLRGVL